MRICRYDTDNRTTRHYFSIMMSHYEKIVCSGCSVGVIFPVLIRKMAPVCHHSIRTVLVSQCEHGILAFLFRAVSTKQRKTFGTGSLNVGRWRMVIRHSVVWGNQNCPHRHAPTNDPTPNTLSVVKQFQAE